MTKKIIAILILAILFFSIIVIAAKPNPVTVDVVPSNGHATVTIPSRAIEVTPGVFYLGTTIHNGELVEGYAFVHKKNNAKPETTCGNGVCERGENAKKCSADCGGGTVPDSDCYDFIAKGAKWKTVEPYIINTANNHGLTEAFVASTTESGIAKWENAANTNIVGAQTITTAQLSVDTVQPDGLNEVYFGSIADSGAIAVNTIWGIFSGSPRKRKLVEWDLVFDQVDYPWSSSGEAGKMDFENIDVHELGHTMGMGDLYESTCSEETMYGYAGYGETKKRTLNAGDITGIQKLYGN
ncbi:MAG: matrixin family metalloprotease [Candidatus Diapherotrites archaeon]|uniref:Matrixin family metalloprotease n=1 Tax=Candidatus Iainarchaeum sp. TaxID=3101447 RepID=A0A8T5GCY8_9ARCH|nr:matrixin family metalloprotease [Candidatus Diapherotrites archaeon]